MNSSARQTEIVSSREVKCCGDDDWGGHPTVFYTMGEDQHQVACMYCNKLFIYESAD